PGRTARTPAGRGHRRAHALPRPPGRGERPPGRADRGRRGAGPRHGAPPPRARAPRRPRGGRGRGVRGVGAGGRRRNGRDGRRAGAGVTTEDGMAGEQDPLGDVLGTAAEALSALAPVLREKVLTGLESLTGSRPALQEVSF